MSKILLLVLTLIACAVIITAFFMPWARVNVSLERILPTGGGEIVNTLEGFTENVGSFAGMEFDPVVRGKDIPMLVNNKSSKVAVTFISLLFKNAESLERKSYLVYMPVLLAVICALLAILGIENKTYILIMTILSGLLSGAGLYEFKTVNFSSLVTNVEIMYGIWVTLYAFFAIFIIGLFWFFVYKERRWRIRW